MEINAEILEEAVTWYLDLNSANSDDSLHEAHTRWLESNPLHQKAWQRVEKLQKTMDRLPGEIRTGTMDNVRRSRREMIKVLTLMLMVGGVGTAWTKKTTVYGFVADYRTRVGQQRDIFLADGSFVNLNTNTAFDVNYDNAIRELTLHYGEIQIATSEDKQARPFIVRTRHGQIRALGTRFQIHCDDDKTQVGVFEHAVEIMPEKMLAKPIRLQSGQQAGFTFDRYGDVRALPDTAAAWTQGLLIVSNWRLDRFIKELSRYHKGVLDYDPAVSAYRISGSFHLNDTRAVLENLSGTLPVRIHYFTRFWARVEPA